MFKNFFDRYRIIAEMKVRVLAPPYFLRFVSKSFGHGFIEPQRTNLAGKLSDIVAAGNCME